MARNQPSKSPEKGLGKEAKIENVLPETTQEKVQETNSQEHVSQTEPNVLGMLLAKIEDMKSDLTELKTAVAALSQKPEKDEYPSLKEYKPLERSNKPNKK